MKVAAPVRFAFFLLLFSIFTSADGRAEARPKHRYILYAIIVEPTPVNLADGAEWMMDKGDAFPVLMFKELQTKVVLQLAGTSFWTEAKRVRIVPEKEVTDEVLASYRRNVEVYLDGRAKRWKAEAKEKK